MSFTRKRPKYCGSKFSVRRNRRVHRNRVPPSKSWQVNPADVIAEAGGLAKHPTGDRPVHAYRAFAAGVDNAVHVNGHARREAVAAARAKRKGQRASQTMPPPARRLEVLQVRKNVCAPESVAGAWRRAWTFPPRLLPPARNETAPIFDMQSHRSAGSPEWSCKLQEGVSTNVPSRVRCRLDAFALSLE